MNRPLTGGTWRYFVTFMDWVTCREPEAGSSWTSIRRAAPEVKKRGWRRVVMKLEVGRVVVVISKERGKRE